MGFVSHVKNLNYCLLIILIYSRNCISEHNSIDRALLQVEIHGPVKGQVSILAQNSDCYLCSLIEIGHVNINNGEHIINLTLYSNHSTTVKVISLDDDNRTSQVLCKETVISVNDQAVYNMVIDSDEKGGFTCNFFVSDNGVNGYLPVLFVFILLGGLALSWITLKFLYRRVVLHKGQCCYREKNEALVQADLGSTNSNSVVEPPSIKKSARLISLDTFRGLSLIIMIFVNYGGGKYWFFAHSSWNGLTVADLVFPWFIFIMGAALAIVMNSNHSKDKNKWVILQEIVVRTIKLFVLGLMINSAGRSGNDLSRLRIPGVLQRFSLTYLVVALTELIFSGGYKKHNTSSRWYDSFRDVIYFWPNWAVAFACLAVQIIVTYAVPYDMFNCPTGYIGPGGISEDGKYYNCTGGVAKYIDLQVFGPTRIYQSATCQSLYGCSNHDPEGLLGTLTSIFLCFLGVQAGRIICKFTTVKERLVRWFIWSLLLGCVTLLLCGASQNGGPIPINKNLWSASFVLAQAASGFFVLAVFYLLIDVFQLWTGAPFYYPGMNSIFVYVGSEVFENLIPVSFAVSNTHLSQLFMNLWSVTFWVLLSAYMYYKQIFIAV